MHARARCLTTPLMRDAPLPPRAVAGGFDSRQRRNAAAFQPASSRDAWLRAPSAVLRTPGVLTPTLGVLATPQHATTHMLGRSPRAHTPIWQPSATHGKEISQQAKKKERQHV